MNKNVFRIPYVIYFIQSSLNLIITFMMLLAPILVLILIILFNKSWGIFSPIIMYFFYIILGTIGLLIISLFFIGRSPDRLESYRNFKESFYRDYVIKNVPCPKCHGKLISFKKLNPMALFFCEYSYQCGSCNNKFVPVETKGERSLRTLWTLKKKRS